MIRIYVKKQNNYPISAVNIKKRLKKYFKKSGIVSDSVCYIALVGENMMEKIGKKYLIGPNTIHPVLSFTEQEVTQKFIYPDPNIIRLGEIVVCYPVAFKQAKEQNKLIEEKVYELIEHGAKHLLGEHHN